MDALELAQLRAECYAEGSDAPEWMRQEATMYALLAIAQELRRMNERAEAASVAPNQVAEGLGAIAYELNCMRR